MTSSVKCGGGRGSAEEGNIQAPDFRKVPVLGRADWLRITDETIGVDKDRERLRGAAKQREALHLHSQEVVTKWSNTVAGQRKKKLEAKKVREQIEEEKRKQMDLEEANYREQKRKEAVQKAELQLYYQTDRVKGLHRALLLTEVLKEREAQMELKQQTKSATERWEKEILEKIKTREDEAMKQQEEKTQKKRLERMAFAEDLKNQMKENESIREQQEKKEKQKDQEEIQRLFELQQREQRTAAEQQAMHKRNIKQAYMDLQQREHLRKIEAQKQKIEEERRKLFLSAKQKMTKLRKEKDKEIIRETQQHREGILDKVMVRQQEQMLHEEQRTAKAAEEMEARRAQLQQEEEKKKAAMLKSITEHREFISRENEMRKRISEQDSLEEQMKKMEADRIFAEMKQQETKKIREENEKLKQSLIAQMAEKQSRHQHVMTEERKFAEKNVQLTAEEEKRFQEYSQQVIDAAAEAQKMVFPLYKAARKGIPPEDGPASRGVQPTCLVQDVSGTVMPRIVTRTTEKIKKLHEAADINQAKRRLGFTWS
uniref:Cilia and flagella associated protein 210 n=1 Tax=Oryzias sinensis TaxID=183150 RepID=A0A8C7ZWX7_9TELE